MANGQRSLALVAMSVSSSSSLPFVYISGDEVRELVSMSDLIEEVSRGLQWFSAGEEGGVVQPVRSVVPVEKYSGYGPPHSHAPRSAGSRSCS